MDFRLGARGEIPKKAPEKSIKMREIPIFAKSPCLENHMGRAQLPIISYKLLARRFLGN